MRRGKKDDSNEKEIAGRILEHWQIYAPNMTWGNVISRNIQTPLDVCYRHPDMIEWGVITGSHSPSKLDRYRPTPEMAHYRIPGVKSMYICSCNVHSGVGIGRGSSYNCFKAIAEDLDLPRIWEQKGREY